jgi:hypothetical protein
MLDRPKPRSQRPNRMRLSAAWLASLLVAGGIAAPRAQQPAPDSVERIRAALLKSPSRLTLRERPPDFTVHIEEQRPLQDVFDSKPWATLAGLPQARVTIQTPVEGATRGFTSWGGGPGAAGGSGGVDALDVLNRAKRLVYLRRVRDARAEVQRTLADYCAAQPNAGAGIQVCSTLPALY